MDWKMAREPGPETIDSSEGGPNGGDGAWNRRAILSALAGAPVILTLSSSLAQAQSNGDSMTFDYLCNPPRDDLTPGEQAICNNPP